MHFRMGRNVLSNFWVVYDILVVMGVVSLLVHIYSLTAI